MAAAFLLANAIGISIIKRNVREGKRGLPIWARWFNGWSCWLVAAGLAVALLFLLQTFRVYLKGKMMPRETRALRTFLILFTLAYTGVALLVVIAYVAHWDLSPNPPDWPGPVQAANFAVEVIFDVLAVGMLVSIHHRHFKPRPKRKKALVTYEDEDGSIEEETENEHISVYEDDETSMASGTIRHEGSEQGDVVSVRTVSYRDFGDALAGGAIHAALAGGLEFQGRARRQRAYTGGEGFQEAGAALAGLVRSELLPVAEADSLDEAATPTLTPIKAIKGAKDSDSVSTGSAPSGAGFARLGVP